MELKYLFKLAGVDPTQGKARIMLEQSIDSGNTYYADQFIVGRTCKHVRSIGEFPSLEAAMYGVRDYIQHQAEDPESIEADMADELLAMIDPTEPPQFQTKNGNDAWDIGTDQYSIIIVRGERPTSNNI